MRGSVFEQTCRIIVFGALDEKMSAFLLGTTEPPLPRSSRPAPLLCRDPLPAASNATPPRRARSMSGSENRQCMRFSFVPPKKYLSVICSVIVWGKQMKVPPLFPRRTDPPPSRPTPPRPALKCPRFSDMPCMKNIHKNKMASGHWSPAKNEERSWYRWSTGRFVSPSVQLGFR